MILSFQTVNDKILPTGFLPLLNDLGQPVTGLPNGPADDAPGFITVTAPLAEQLPFNHDGLDIEDLHTLPGGGFIMVEEYGPSVVIVSPTGHVLKRYTPGGKTWPLANYSVSDILPAVLKERRANRGLEGIAVSADGRTAYTVMQSPLGSTAVGSPQRDSMLVRILRMDITDPLNLQVTGQFVAYFQPMFTYPAGNFPRDLKISAVSWVSEDRLLILERSDKLGAGGVNQGGAKLVLIDLTEATDVSDAAQFPAAAAIPPVLENGTTDLGLLGIVPASSRVVLDVNLELPTITDFKLEGLSILNDNDVALSNDNDFGIGDSPGRSSKVWQIRLSQPLR
jgi:alkaline phosphatase